MDGKQKYLVVLLPCWIVVSISERLQVLPQR